MTDEQFEKLMAKLEEIQRELSKPDKGTWGPLFQPPQMPEPTFAPSWLKWPLVVD